MNSSIRGSMWCAGDGQIAALWAMEAQRMWVYPVVLWTKRNSPAGQVVSWVKNRWRMIVSDKHKDAQGNIDIDACYSDKRKIAAFARNSLKAATIDWENIPTKCLDHLEFLGVPTRPSKHALEVTKHRIREKDAYNNILGKNSTTPYVRITSPDDLKHAFWELKAGRMKTCEWGYDWKGQWIIKSESDIDLAWQEIEEANGKYGSEFIYEKNVRFLRETSVIVARSPRGQTVAYNPIINIHQDGILATSLIWFDDAFDEDIIEDMKKRAIDLAEGIHLEWVMAVEMFQRSRWKPLINEIAPRPHNSGHGTIEAYDVNQYTMQIRAGLDEVLLQPKLQNKVIMTNVIGDQILSPHIQNAPWFEWNDTWSVYETGPDWKHVQYVYGKWTPSPGRKMWHRSIII